MIKTLIRVISLTFLNFLVLVNSSSIDIFQLVNDFSSIPILRTLSLNSTFILVSIAISIFAALLIEFFKPFIEVYLMFYLKITFYFFINLVSFSTIYIALRVYGYSRMYLLIYLLTSTLLLFITDKKLK
ncbi:hypothetical protein OBA39_02835 [Acidimicrobiaceae bacterium]|nr:hypothetical protein [Acidimicrobiaceae bacterium]